MTNYAALVFVSVAASVAIAQDSTTSVDFQSRAALQSDTSAINGQDRLGVRTGLGFVSRIVGNAFSEFFPDLREHAFQRQRAAPLPPSAPEKEHQIPPITRQGLRDDGLGHRYFSAADGV
jgi:hypothetical protein